MSAWLRFGSVALGLVVLLATGCGDGAADLRSGGDERLVPIAGEAIELQPSYAVERSYTGTLTPRRASGLGFERGGLVVALEVDEGDSVQAGDVMARLDPRSVQAQLESSRAFHRAAQALLQELEAGPRIEVLDQARAEVQERVANVGELQVEWERQKDLVAGKVNSQALFDAVDYQLKAAKARLDAARERLQELENGTRAERLAAQRAEVARQAAVITGLEVALDQTRLKAPFDGVITRRFVDEGTVLDPGATVFRILDSAPLEARIGVPGSVAAGLEPGASVCLEVGAGDGQRVNATLRTVLQEVDPVTRTRTAVFDLVDSTEGQQATAGAVVRWWRQEEVMASGFWLPSSALMRSQRGLWACMVLSSDGAEPAVGTAERREVQVLHSASGQAFVQGTLSAGDIVLHGDLNKVAPGQRVRVTAATESGETR